MPECGTCRKNNSVSIRQGMGCGFEVRVDGAQPFTPAFWRERDRKTTTCPGFTSTLPEVREALDYYPHFESGTLVDALDGERPTSVFLDALVHLRAGIRELERSKLPKPKGKE